MDSELALIVAQLTPATPLAAALTLCDSLSAHIAANPVGNPRQKSLTLACLQRLLSSDDARLVVKVARVVLQVSRYDFFVDRYHFSF